MKFQHVAWFIPPFVVVLFGYFVSAAALIALRYYGFLADSMRPELYKPVYAFFAGVLGSTVSISIHYAKDVNSVASSASAPRPTAVDSFGYLLKQIWGGVVAVVFIFATELGMIAAFPGQHDPSMRLKAVLVIGFIIGSRPYLWFGALGQLINPQNNRPTDAQPAPAPARAPPAPGRALENPPLLGP